MNAATPNDGFLDEVMRLSGLESRAWAARAAGAALGALSAGLANDERRLLAHDLGEGWKQAVMEGGRHRQPGAREGIDTVEDFYRRMAAAEDVGPGFGREHAQAVCTALAGMLEEGTLARLRRALPESLAALLSPAPHRGPSTAPDTRTRDGLDRARRGTGDTLAAGRPGSTRPVSESRPMQAGSILASDNPHGDTKISSAPGVPADRRADTLSSGGPGSDRPVSESGEE